MPALAMPDDDARKKAGERLAADLRAMREERGLSAQNLREKLRVPGGLFEAFESGRLLGHPMFNRVYLRSLTRSYADATETPSAPVLAALDATLNGEYEEGRLQREIEAHETPEEAEAEKGEAVEEGEATKASEGTEEAGGEEAGTSGAAAKEEPDWATSSPPGASTEEAEQREREKEERAREREREREERARRQQQERRQERRQERVAAQESTAAARESHAEEEQAAQKEQSAQREERSAHQRSRRRRGRRQRSSSSSNVGRWIAGLLVLAAVAVGLYFLIPSLGGGGAETTRATATAADTAVGGDQGGAQQQDQRPSANLQLGETMNFTVVASGGPVRDLKVTRDQDVRRPYWIEEGQAKVFPARDRIVIENPSAGEATLQNVRILAEGYPYPTDRRDAQGRIVITRQNMQSFADTLRGQPAQIPAQRDTASLFSQ